jgi:hypothetical protein
MIEIIAGRCFCEMILQTAFKDKAVAALCSDGVCAIINVSVVPARVPSGRGLAFYDILLKISQWSMFQ